MNYSDAKNGLTDRMMFGVKLGLNNIRKLLRRLGNPERNFKSIHIAGTNGKGSSAAILSSILTASGKLNGLYTSPHISSVRERFQVNGKQISRSDFASCYGKIAPLLDEIPCTYFECATALAFLWFKEQDVDTAVIETGLGGRLDATNILNPVLSIITSIGYDHMEHLGDSLTGITKEKCGIIKKGVPILSGVEQLLCRKIIVKQSVSKSSGQLYISSDLVKIINISAAIEGSRFDIALNGTGIENAFLSLPGQFQIKNAQNALAAAVLLKKSGIIRDYTGIIKGLREINWPCRLNLIHKKPYIIVDVAHNEAGFTVLRSEISRFFPKRKPVLVIGMAAEKDWKSSVKPIIPVCGSAVGIPFPGGKGVSQEDLQKHFKSGKIPFYKSNSVRGGISKALELAGKSGLILFAGSHYTVDSLKKAINSLDRMENID